VLDAAPAASVSLTVVRGVDERQVEVTFAPSE